MNAPTFDPAQKLRSLRERAGFSRDKLAPLLDFAKGSSVQRYELSENYGQRFLPLDLVTKLVPILEGLGSPPITKAEILALAGVDTITTLDSEQHFEKTYKAAESMLKTLIDNGFLNLTADKITPIALGIARRSSAIEPDTSKEFEDVMNYIRDLQKIGE